MPVIASCNPCFDAWIGRDADAILGLPPTGKPVRVEGIEGRRTQ